jgi:competence protein ComFC
MSLILDLIFPKICYGCGKTGEYLCPKCQKHLTVLNTKAPKNGFDGGLSLFKYQSFIKSAITDLKYNFVSDNSTNLANLMAKILKSDFPNLVKYWRQNDFILIPIPLHLSRQNWRGFNQSEILAKKIAKILSLNFSNEVLIRHQNTAIQARLKKTGDRTKNVANIFSLHPSIGNYKHKNIILFDDVTTTQATLISAFTTLKILSLSHCWYLTLSAG